MSKKKAVVPEVVKEDKFLVIPEILNSSMPSDAPNLEYDESGMVRSFFHRRRLTRMNRADLLKAEIAEHQLKTTTANLNKIKSVVLFSAEINHTLWKYTNEKRIGEAKALEAEASAQKAQQEARQSYFEAENSKFELEMKLKEVKDEGHD